MSWFSVNCIGNVAYVALKDEIGSFDVCADDFALKLGDAPSVELTIDSNGGDGSCGLKLHGLLSKLRTTVFIKGQCCSSAVTVAMSGITIRIQRDAKILVHSPVAYSCGTAERLEKEARSLKKLRSRIRDVICERTGQSRRVVAGWLSRDTWFDADQALAVGLVDEVIPPPPISRIKIAPIAASSGKVVKQQTESETLFRSLLNASKVEVRDLPSFGKDLAEWFKTNVREVK
jgi:ATP-dependent protease ClpP protease subunit